MWTGQSSRKLFAVICQSKVIQDAGGGSHKGDRASVSFVDTKGCLFVCSCGQRNPVLKKG